MPNEGKSVRTILQELDGLLNSMAVDVNSEAGNQIYQEHARFLRSALSAVVLGAVERLPKKIEPLPDFAPEHEYNAALDDARSALIAYAQEIAKDV